MVRRSSHLVLVLFAALTAASAPEPSPAPRFSAEQNLAAHYATRDTVSAFQDVSGFAVEGGGQRSLLLAVAVQRGLDLLKQADGVVPGADGEGGADGVGGVDGKTSIPRRAADIAAGVSGGSWGVAALTYSATLSTRVGPYVEPEMLTAEGLTKEKPAETMTRFADPNLFDWDMPIQVSGASVTYEEIAARVTKRICGPVQGNLVAYLSCMLPVESGFAQLKALIAKYAPTFDLENIPSDYANVIEAGALPDNVFKVKPWWEYFTAYYMYSFDVDPRTELSWCSKEEAEKQYHETTSKTSVVGDANFPNKPLCQRPGAPYPILAASNRSSFASSGKVYPVVE